MKAAALADLPRLTAATGSCTDHMQGGCPRWGACCGERGWRRYAQSCLALTFTGGVGGGGQGSAVCPPLRPFIEMFMGVPVMAQR